MKKIIALVAGLAMSMTAVFAENTIHLGAYFPLDKANYDGSGVFSTGVGGALDYTHVADGGFTWKAGLGLNTLKTDDVEVDDTKLDDGVDFNLGLGFGWSFIHDEKMTFSVTGDFGLRFGGFDKKIDYQIGGVTVAEAKYRLDKIVFYIGPEATFTYRFTDHLGAFGAFGIFYQKSLGDQEFNVEYDLKVKDENVNLVSGKEKMPISGFIFQPKLGLSWTF